ncbi:hypothetical protein SEA_BACHOME_34 [Mycobacterium phage Bachome]|nr:hypothetical protein SEA_BACHOME_34 [Mycobacterium phage Bachome]
MSTTPTRRIRYGRARQEAVDLWQHGSTRPHKAVCRPFLSGRELLG